MPKKNKEISNENSNIPEESGTPLKKKRGRKPKATHPINEENIVLTSSLESVSENITVTIEEATNTHTPNLNVVNDIITSNSNTTSNITTSKNKKYVKKVKHEKNKIIESETNEIKRVETTTTEISLEAIESSHFQNENLSSKKRGRKPKGGKIICQSFPIISNKEERQNVILHLKCSFKDLQVDNLFGSHLDGYTFSNQLNNKQTSICYEIIKNGNENRCDSASSSSSSSYETLNLLSVILDENDDNDQSKYEKNTDIREIWKKLKVLEHNLHINNICDKKSACFWCTYDFDNPPIYIPKHFIKNSYQVYGCFCSPECATAFLMNEHIDSSSKFERYQLINHIYSKIYNYSKNIKPAPNPYYMLEKYYGNLSIQEYRALLLNERLFLVVDKPLTRIMPELHEDNDDFIINNKIIPSNNLQIKKKLQKKQTKNNILNERFGLTSTNPG
jgi:hypothetical protein